MKQKLLKRLAMFLLALQLCAAAMPLMASAAAGGTAVTGYKLTNSSGSTLGSLSKGSVADVTVSLKDPGHTTDQVKVEDIDVSRLVDSFSGGTAPVVKITSAGKDALTFDVKFAGLVYGGRGRALKLLVGLKGQSAEYESLEVSVSEAVEYEDPKPPEQTTPDTAPAPMVLVSRSDLAKPIEAGQETEVTIFFKNLSNTALKSVVATFSPSEALSISGGSTSFQVGEIAGGKTGSVTLKIKAMGTVASANQSLGVELKFNYFNNVAMTQGSASDKVSIPAVGRDSVPQPVVLVTRSPINHPISSGESMDVTITIKNAGKTKLVYPVAYLTSSESLIIMNDTSTIILNDLEPDQSTNLVVKVKAAKEISSANQSVNLELKYSYDNGGTMTQATATDRVNLSANSTSGSRIDASVPNVIISTYTYGGESVAAGAAFPLEFTFTNTGKLRIENIVVAVDGGETFTMDGSTNTFYYNSLAAGGNQSQKVPMRALPAAKTGAQTIGVSFKYEYVDASKRATASADIKISVPVYQKDRFQINAPVLPGEIYSGSEMALSLAYVNKGKSEVSNVEATVEGEGVETPARTQYLGNIAAGASGNIGFALTPQQSGEVKLKLRISYEDANQQLQTKEFPLTLNAMEQPVIEDTTGMEEEQPKAVSSWVWIGLALVAAAAVATGVIVIKKKKAAGEAQMDGESWDNWDETVAAAPAGEESSGKE